MDTCSQARPPRLPRPLALALALAGLVAMTARPSPARAETQKVVLAGVPEVLASATDTALAPWALQIIRTPAPLPPDQARAVPEARALARKIGAGAVIWLASEDRGHVLLVYDAFTDRHFSRPLPADPPFDEPTAAAVALSIKTLLRHSAVAPPAERVPPPPLPPPPAPVAPALPRHGVEVRASLRLSVPDAGEDSPGTEPRFGLGVAWWPAFLPGPHGIGLRVDAGPGVQVSRGGFRGELQDLTVAADLRRRMRLGQRLELVPAAGLGLHITSLDGVMQPGAAPARTRRLVPSVDAGLDLYLRLGRGWHIGVGVHGSLMTRTGDHVRNGREIARAPSWLMDAGAALRLSF